MFSQEMVFSGVTKSETVEMNADVLRSDGWRKIVAQVESALCREDRSRQALDQLQQLATEQGASTQFLLKSVIRETIRLTLECFGTVPDMLKRESTPAAISIAERPIDRPALVLTPEQKEAQDDAAVFTAMSRVLQPIASDKSLLHWMRPTQAQPKLSPEAQAQQALEARQSELRILCTEIHRHRSQLGLSLKQIHSTTFIPLHHLQSLDDGTIDRLPEDVYLRGFLNRLEKCFQLTDGQLTRRLPVPPQIERSNPVIRSSANSSYGRSSNPITPNYAYLAYAALMAGGVCWIAQQGSPKSNLPQLKIDTPVSGPHTGPQKHSSQQVQPTQAKLTQTIAHPEVFV